MRQIQELKTDDVFYIRGQKHIVVREWKDYDKPLIAKLDFMGYLLSFFEIPEQEISEELNGTISVGATISVENPRDGVFNTAREIAEYHLSHKTDVDKLEYDILRYLERQISLNIKA